MAEDLSAVVRKLAQEAGIAVELDRPYTPAMSDRYVRDVRRRRVAGASVLALVAVGVVGVGAFGVERLTRELPPVDIVSEPTPSDTQSPMWEPTPSETPTVTATPTPTPTPTPPPPTPPVVEPEEEETTPPPPPPPPPPAPGAVSSLRASPGAGSGEITVSWKDVPEATGYRVYRSDSADGPFALVATYDKATGTVSVSYTGGYEFIHIVYWSDLMTLQYDEAALGAIGYFRVSAFNAGGEGPAAGPVCAVAPGSGQDAPTC